MSWTDERVEKLKQLCAEGKTASQIAKALGGVTRNAVIGKLHRLGLSNKSKEGEEGVTEAPAEAPAEGEVAEPTVVEPGAEVAEVATPATEGKVAAEAVAEAEPVSFSREFEEDDNGRGRDYAPRFEPVVEVMDPERERAVAAAAEIEKKARKLSLLELTERTCKWPIGDPATEDFYFCGHPSMAGKPYCETHVLVAFQPMSSRRERDRQRATQRPIMPR